MKESFLKNSTKLSRNHQFKLQPPTKQQPLAHNGIQFIENDITHSMTTKRAGFENQPLSLSFSLSEPDQTLLD